MRRHPLTGAQIVAPLEFFADGALIVRHHHERQDGSGYPDGLMGESIPIGARIVAVADVYDALTSDRPYRRALSHRETHERMMSEADRSLDGRLVAILFDEVTDAPPGTAALD
jgi:HD-GYP domain-containing protein (c-di-GMP phosphodiesterase class II)